MTRCTQAGTIAACSAPRHISFAPTKLKAKFIVGSVQRACRRPGCDVVPFESAMQYLDAQRVDTVVVDVSTLDPAALSLLSALWKRQSITPVWMASRAGGRCERVLRQCADGPSPRGPRVAEVSRGPRVAEVPRGPRVAEVPRGHRREAPKKAKPVSLRALSTLSAAQLIALRHLSLRLKPKGLSA